MMLALGAGLIGLIVIGVVVVIGLMWLAGTYNGLVRYDRQTDAFEQVFVEPGSQISSIFEGPDGKLWRIRFGPDGEPLAPEIVARGLAFPDAVSVLPGDLQAAAARGTLVLAPPTRAPCARRLGRRRAPRRRCW